MIIKLLKLTLSVSGLNNCDPDMIKVDPKSLSIMVWPSCNSNYAMVINLSVSVKSNCVMYM